MSNAFTRYLELVSSDPGPRSFTRILFSVALERYFKPPVNPRTHLISSLTLMPLRFSLASVLMVPSEKGKLIMLAKMFQDRFDEYLSNPCIPQLFPALGMLPEPGRNPETKQAPMPWWCTFNNVDVVEKRLKTQHGRITVENICIGIRLRNTM